MINRILLALITASALLGLELNKNVLLKKITAPTPYWIADQIRDDFAPFQEKGVTKENIDQTQAKISEIIRITIKNNQVSWHCGRSVRLIKRLTPAIDILEKLAQHVKLPDVQFLVSLEDCYDFPELIEKTSCPVFTICKRKENPWGILWPEMRWFDHKWKNIKSARAIASKYPWSEKKAIAFWRGSSTGHHHNLWNWDCTPRANLLFFSEQHPDLVDAHFPNLLWVDWKTKDVFRKQKLGGFKPPKGQQAYKYLLAVDGNTFPSSIIWQLGINCAVIKNESEYLEWFYRGLQENVHYVSYHPDCRDLETVICNLRANDNKAQEIAKAGMQFIDEYLSPEGTAYYLYKVIHAYAGIQRGVL